MGATVSLILSKKVRGLNFDSYALASCFDKLDKIAKANGISPPLSSFMCNPEAEAEDVPEGEELEERWYDPQDGLRTVSSLILALQADDGRARKQVDKGGVLTPLWRKLGLKSGLDGEWAETVLADLKNLEKVLQTASKKGSQFLLLLD
jgi:hypothetical protein